MFRFLSDVFDRWSIVHFAFWLVYGANVQWHGWSLSWTIPVFLVCVVFWELFEEYMEMNDWVTGQEIPLNRWLGDPVSSILGAAFGFWLVA